MLQVAQINASVQKTQKWAYILTLGAALSTWLSFAWVWVWFKIIGGVSNIWSISVNKSLGVNQGEQLTVLLANDIDLTKKFVKANLMRSIALWHIFACSLILYGINNWIIWALSLGVVTFFIYWSLRMLPKKMIIVALLIWVSDLAFLLTLLILISLFAR